MNESPFKASLQALLSDPAFFPEGGYLGFGLNHEYPVEPGNTDDVAYIASCLKGSDAVIMKACRDLNLDLSVKLSYDSDRTQVVMDEWPSAEIEGQTFDSYDDSLVTVLRYHGAQDISINWITHQTNHHRQICHYMAFGSETSTAVAYAYFCLIVQVGPFTDRSGSPLGDEEQDQQLSENEDESMVVEDENSPVTEEGDGDE